MPLGPNNIYGQILGIVAIVGIVILVVWLYKRRNKLKLPFLIKFTDEYKDTDITTNKALAKVGKWVRIGEGSYRAECSINEEKIRQIVEQEYPNIPKKNIIVYNPASGYAGL